VKHKNTSNSDEEDPFSEEQGEPFDAAAAAACY
jgi:hypothetical protein